MSFSLDSLGTTEKATLLFVLFPFSLLLLLSKGDRAKSTQPKPTKLSIEKVIDIIDDDDEIIIVRKKKHKYLD